MLETKRGDMTLQLPFGYPPEIDVPQLTGFDQVFAFAVVYLFLWTLISFLLPRPWFVALFKIAFPFMPDKLEEIDHS